MSIFVRNLSTTSSQDIGRYEKQLTKMLGGYNLQEDHMRSLHSANCPERSEDVFNELDAKRIIEFHKYLSELKEKRKAEKESKEDS